MAEPRNSSWHWRNTMKPARFFIFDARAVFFFVLVLVHARMWTFGLMLFVLAVFWAFERRGLSFAAAMRAIRIWFTGKYRPAWLFTRHRRFLDTGSD